jgi:hypothetical protein
MDVKILGQIFDSVLDEKGAESALIMLADICRNNEVKINDGVVAVQLVEKAVDAVGDFLEAIPRRIAKLPKEATTLMVYDVPLPFALVYLQEKIAIDTIKSLRGLALGINKSQYGEQSYPRVMDAMVKIEPRMTDFHGGGLADTLLIVATATRNKEEQAAVIEGVSNVLIKVFGAELELVVDNLKKGKFSIDDSQIKQASASDLATSINITLQVNGLNGEVNDPRSRDGGRKR